MSELWQDISEAKQVRKMNNLQRAKMVLQKRGISYECLSPFHFRVGEYDYWPTTGYFKHRSTGAEGRGLNSFLNALEGKDEYEK